MSNKTKNAPKQPQYSAKQAAEAAKLAAQTVMVSTGAANLVASVLYEIFKR